jgi:hypothetical protein
MKYFLCILTLFIVSSVLAQDTPKDSSANYVAQWGKGENKVFYIIHNKDQYESGELKSQFSFTYEAYVTILDSAENNYIVQWVFHLPEKVKEAHPELVDSLPVFEGMKMIFKTSETGEFKELINWQEVKDSYIKMMEISLPQKMDSTAKAAVEKSVAMFNSKEMVESALIKEIKLFYLPYGNKFTTSEIKTPVQLPNPFSSEPLPALETYQITELKPQQDYFTLVIKQDIDKAGAQKFFEDFLKKLDTDTSNAVDEAKKMMQSFGMKDYSEYKFIPSTGWPERINYERTIKNGQTTKTDSFLIEMKK